MASSAIFRASEMSRELWNSLAAKAGLMLDARQHDLLHKFLNLLFAANERMNLTRITDRPDAEVLHIADSLALLPHLPSGRHKLADVGSGGGLPGIVLAIARPDARIVLIEATRKKADFLIAAAAELGLSNVDVAPLRAEEAGRSEWRESFNVATARAVATLPILIPWLMPLLKPGGYALAMKGPKAAEELRQSRVRQAAEIIPATLPSGLEHVIVRIPKPSIPQFRSSRPPRRRHNKSI